MSSSVPRGSSGVKASSRDLRVWQLAMDVAVEVYELTEKFPSREQFSLAQQMRRAATSVPSNIAEGYGRKTHRQKYSFLEQSLGSLFELETQMELSHRLHYVADEPFQTLAVRLADIGRGINGLMKYVERDSHEFTNARPQPEEPRNPRNPRN